MKFLLGAVNLLYPMKYTRGELL